MSSRPRLQLDRVEVRFGSKPGLVGVSMSVGPGETVAIVGTSGAGKSSLLRTAAGLDEAGGGRISIDGVDLTSAQPESRGAVYLHQTPLLFPHLSVGENVAFPLQVRRWPREEAGKRVREVLADLDLTSLSNRSPATLSGGQKHRVALARAIAGRPPVLLLDEPLSALDPTLREDALEAIRAAIAGYDPATLFVTHDLAEAGAIADRIAVLLDGRIRQISSPPQLFGRPESVEVATFVGFRNRLVGELDGERFRAPGWDLPIQTELRGRVVLLFRAESLLPHPEGELFGRIVSISHAPSGTRLKVQISGVELEAHAPAGLTPRQADGARFRLEISGLRAFADR